MFKLSGQFRPLIFRWILSVVSTLDSNCRSPNSLLTDHLEAHDDRSLSLWSFAVDTVDYSIMYKCLQLMYDLDFDPPIQLSLFSF